MRRLHRTVVVTASALLLVAPGCGDDGGADRARADQAGVEADAREQSTQAADDEGTEEPTTTTSTVPDAEAEDPPGDSGGELEGRDEPPVFVADLSGETEVPGPGDPVGVGRSEIETGGEHELCIDMVADGLEGDVTDAHIHEGEVGASGPPVVPIGEPTEHDGERDTWTDICVMVDPAVLERMVADPDGFYVNVHTSAFPDGAVRGQLTASTIFDLTLS